jgi:hypothetical protein
MSSLLDMRSLSPERLAQTAIAVLFIAILRTLGEYYRFRWTLGSEVAMRAFEVFIPGLVLAVIGAIAAVGLYFARRFRLVAWAVAITIAALLLYKLIFITS